jgi:hypothetical protein
MARQAKSKNELSSMGDEILKKAQEKGTEHSFMFTTAFKRYKEHLAHLEALEEAILEAGPLVTKAYVKDRGNLYVNPAISAYNQTARAADMTAQLLMKYIETPLKDPDAEGGDAFDEY